MTPVSEEFWTQHFKHLYRTKTFAQLEWWGYQTSEPPEVSQPFNDFYRLEPTSFTIFKARALSSSKRKNFFFLKMVATTSRHPTGWTFEWSVAVLQDGRPMMVHEAQTQWQRFDVFLGMGWNQLRTWRMGPQDLVQWLLAMVSLVSCCHRFHIGLLDSEWPNFMAYFHGSDPHHLRIPASWEPIQPKYLAGFHPHGRERCFWGCSLYRAWRSYPLRFLSAHLSQRSPVSVLMSFCLFRPTFYPVPFFKIWDILLFLCCFIYSISKVIFCRIER